MKRGDLWADGHRSVTTERRLATWTDDGSRPLPEIEPDPPATPVGLLSISLSPELRFSIAKRGPCGCKSCALWFAHWAFASLVT